MAKSKRKAFLVTVERSTIYRVVGPTSLLGEEGEKAFDYAVDNFSDEQVTVEEVGGETLRDSVDEDREYQKQRKKGKR